jgi:hypothetical protein
VLGFTPTLGQVRVATLKNIEKSPNAKAFVIRNL